MPPRDNYGATKKPFRITNLYWETLIKFDNKHSRSDFFSPSYKEFSEKLKKSRPNTRKVGAPKAIPGSIPFPLPSSATYALWLSRLKQAGLSILVFHLLYTYSPRLWSAAMKTLPEPERLMGPPDNTGGSWIFPLVPYTVRRPAGKGNFSRKCLRFAWLVALLMIQTYCSYDEYGELVPRRPRRLQDGNTSKSMVPYSSFIGPIAVAVGYAIVRATDGMYCPILQSAMRQYAHFCHSLGDTIVETVLQAARNPATVAAGVFAASKSCLMAVFDAFF